YGPSPFLVFSLFSFPLKQMVFMVLTASGERHSAIRNLPSFSFSVAKCQYFQGKTGSLWHRQNMQAEDQSSFWTNMIMYLDF
ncbi:mCG145027, partial [Mus musculus]